MSYHYYFVNMYYGSWTFWGSMRGWYATYF